MNNQTPNTVLPPGTGISLTWDKFAEKYCERQESTPAALALILMEQYERWQCAGWFMGECVMMDSRRLGQLVILPYGPNNTYKVPPDHPFSPRGLASDMSVVVATLPVGPFLASVLE